MKEQPMGDEKPMGQVIQIDETRIRNHLGEMVRGTVEEVLNAMLDAEADQLCGAGRYERSQARQDTRAGSYERTLQTSAGEVNLKVPKLRRQTFEPAIIERYRRRESSVEEALIEMYLAGISVRRVEDITEALWGTFLPECLQPRTSDQGPRGEPYAQGYPCSGGPGGGRPKGAPDRRRPARRQDERGGRSRRAERGRDRMVLDVAKSKSPFCQFRLSATSSAKRYK
jgi:hypothetical protein